MLLPCVFLHLEEDPFLPPGFVAFSIESWCLRGEGPPLSSRGYLLRDSHILLTQGPQCLEHTPPQQSYEPRFQKWEDAVLKSMRCSVIQCEN